METRAEVDFTPASASVTFLSADCAPRDLAVPDSFAGRDADLVSLLTDESLRADGDLTDESD